MKWVGAVIIGAIAVSSASSQPCEQGILVDTTRAHDRAVALLYARANAYRELQNSAAAVQAADGGELTATHNAALQAKLAKLNEGFSRQFCNLKRLDANGREISQR